LSSERRCRAQGRLTRKDRDDGVSGNEQKDRQVSEGAQVEKLKTGARARLPFLTAWELAALLTEAAA